MQKIYWVLADVGEVLVLAVVAVGMILAASRMM